MRGRRPLVLEPTGDVLVDLLARTSLSKRNVDAVEHVNGGVVLRPPMAEMHAASGAALLVNKNRMPEVDETERCTKCRNGDVVLVVNFPGDDGVPIQLCRNCLDRPPGHPVVVAFRG